MKKLEHIKNKNRTICTLKLKQIGTILYSLKNFNSNQEKINHIFLKLNCIMSCLANVRLRKCPIQEKVQDPAENPGSGKKPVFCKKTGSCNQFRIRKRSRIQQKIPDPAKRPGFCKHYRIRKTVLDPIRQTNSPGSNLSRIHNTDGIPLATEGLNAGCCFL